MPESTIRLVPFTDDELKQIQLTIAGKILRLTQDAAVGKVSKEQAEYEMKTLCRCVEKCASHSRR